MADMTPYKNISVLVTGSTGFIGSALAHALSDLGAEVSAVSLKPASEANVKFFRADITNKPSLHEIDGQFDIFFHLAAQTSVPLSAQAPEKAVSVNIDGTSNILDLALISGAKRFVFASTSSVYSFSPGPISESGETSPSTVYGQTKLMAEKLCLEYRKHFAVSIPRLFNVYGPGQSKDVVAFFMKNALASNPITVEGRGSQKRDFLHINDAVQALLLMGQYSGTVNFGSGIGTSISSLAEKVIRSCHSSSKIVYEKGRHSDGDLVCNNSLALSLGWKPSITLEDGLVKMASPSGKHI